MKIVFWGMDEVTSLIPDYYAISSYIACHHGFRVALLQNRFVAGEIDGYFEEVRCCTTSQSRAAQRHTKGILRTIIETRLYSVAADVEDMPRILPVLEQNMDIILIYPGASMNETVKGLMWEADGVIVDMKQEKEAFDRLLLQYDILRLSKHVLFLLHEYFPNGECNREMIRDRYKIPEMLLFEGPRDPEFQMACQMGKLEQYIRRRNPYDILARKDTYLRKLEEFIFRVYEESGMKENTKQEKGGDA